MDHSLYRYSALPRRRAGGAALPQGLTAFAVLFLEHWELEPPADAVRDPRLVGEFGSFTPDFRSWSQREYGLRIGIFRVIDALRQAGIRPVVAANAMALQRLPRLVDTFNDWGCEWLAHGVAATRMLHSRMPLDAQRAHVEQSIAAVVAATGQRPLGWLSQDWGSTPELPGLLQEAGIRYTLDWVNDDQPYWMEGTNDRHPAGGPAEPGLGATPALLSIPLSAEWDDVQCQWLRQVEPRAHADLAVAAFERLRRECAEHQRHAVFGLSIHPWLSGMPSRIRALHTLLERLRAHTDVPWRQPSDIFAAMNRS